ncbi:vWA domain-containing protein [Gayadomonas joobiniege]|uniref:vWA domain-containing protein n=1 Tax=Gayadomonas joobiniege TaxID=1234606 RepID=UPI00036E7997|nr:VWA domain-containing protein [Gayadomonas joobiniege]
MFEFASAWVFLLLPLPLLSYFLLPTRQEKHSAGALRAPFLSSEQLMEEQQVGQASIAKLSLLTLIWLLLISAAARPQWLGEPLDLPAKGRDIMLAIDLSRSMEMQDMQVADQSVDRLQMVKYVMQDFIPRRDGDRLGLILFADTAYLQTPLTRDLNTVSQMLNESLIGLVGDKTAIGDAIALAAKRFANKESSNRILILLTDGQNTSGNLTPEQALKLAKESNIKIYSIGVGADEMMRRGFFGMSRINPSADLDEKMLTKIAEETGGRYFRARDAAELEQIYLTLDQLEPISEESLKMRPLNALFYWPLSIALLLSFVLIGSPVAASLSTRLKS